MKQEHINEIKAILVLAVGMLVLASLWSFTPEDLSWYTSQPNHPPQNLIRHTGAYLAGALLFVFGYSSYFLVLIIFFWSWNKFMNRSIRLSIYKFFGFVVLSCVLSAFFSMLGAQEPTIRFERAGLVGQLFSDFLLFNLDRKVAYGALITMGILALILTGEFLITPIVLSFIEALKGLSWGTKGAVKPKTFGRPMPVPIAPKPKANIAEKIKEIKPFRIFDFTKKDNKDNKKECGVPEKPRTSLMPEPEKPQPQVQKPLKPQIRIAEPANRVEKNIADEPKIVGEYHLPPVELLKDAPQVSTNKVQSDLMSGAKLLEDTLISFGVSARVADIERGPAITRYELEPGPGVKVQKFTTLADDIALAMRASSVRIVAPIPGKNRVGVEIPNSSSAAVFLKDVIVNSQFRSSESKLMLALGKDTAGNPIIADLADMPHLMIAGTTGSGKTVCVNGIIMSMLFNASPDEVKFVMVDPKMVEMYQYNDIPHLLCPTVTDPQKVISVLNWVVSEMQSRYTRLSKEGVRNIKGYNAKGHKMPYIVVIIDELADLMQVSAKAVESSITRLAQLSRAVGIHMILATQRPSVDVITGVIKANFPARISFKVASKVDSRTVLDMNGAETLLGKGDMLFIRPGDPKPIRGQCSFVADDEILKVMDFIKNQQKPIYDESIMTHKSGGSGTGGSDERDEFYDEAVKLVIETNQASVSILQRRLRLGYTRAARLIDMMEQQGLVGPYCGSKPRDILVDREKWLLENMNKKEENVGTQQ